MSFPSQGSSSARASTEFAIDEPDRSLSALAEATPLRANPVPVLARSSRGRSDHSWVSSGLDAAGTARAKPRNERLDLRRLEGQNGLERLTRLCSQLLRGFGWFAHAQSGCYRAMRVSVGSTAERASACTYA